MRLPLIAAISALVVVPAAVLGSATTAGAVSRVEAPLVAGAAADVSANWSGYAATLANTTFTDVTATWRIPAATCNLGQSSSAALWVGLGGYNTGSQSLEQTGTGSDCSVAGKASYYIWYELVPAASVTVKALKVNPHDVVTASVVANDAGILVQIKDRTRKTSFTKQLAMSAPDLTSAEWIAEAPSECGGPTNCRVVPLTNFGSVTFSNVAALAGGSGGTLASNAGWTLNEIQLVPQTHHFFGDPGGGSGSTGAGAAPTPPGADGKSFTVNYVATTT
jgi:antitoxin component of MazEF toxin-antitoxin module